jgi:hypothetical protein
MRTNRIHAAWSGPACLVLAGALACSSADPATSGADPDRDQPGGARADAAPDRGDPTTSAPDTGAPDAGSAGDPSAPPAARDAADAFVATDTATEVPASPAADALPPAGPDASAAPLASLSDDFAGSALDASWSTINGDKIAVRLLGGSLHVQPTQSLLWFNRSQGALIYKNVTGNFKVTTTVHPRKRSAAMQPPSARVHLGGLMARNPTGATENYVFIVVGIDVNDQSVETKTTVNGASTYIGPSWPMPDAQLRICRIGAQLRLYKRAPGTAAWQLAVSYDRPDLPATLQVGPNVYAPADRPDLDVAFDEVRFAPADTPDDCTAE